MCDHNTTDFLLGISHIYNIMEMAEDITSALISKSNENIIATICEELR